MLLECLFLVLCLIILYVVTCFIASLSILVVRYAHVLTVYCIHMYHCFVCVCINVYRGPLGRLVILTKSATLLKECLNKKR